MSVERASKLFSEGLACLAQQDFAEAERKFHEALKIVPEHVPTLMNLALAQYRRGQGRAAGATVRTVIKVDPRNIGAHTFLCGLEREQHRPREALQACDAILTINPALA